MPKPTTKSRQDLRSRFVRNAIPTEGDFADLIAASLNQADDGVLRLPDQSLGLVRQKVDQPVLRLYADPAAEGSVWQMQLAGTDKPGLGLSNQAGATVLFLDGSTGNVGIGTNAPQGKLHLQEAKGSLASMTTGSLLLDHEDVGGASSIVFRSKVNRGSDSAFVEFRDKNPAINDSEAALLTIGIDNDPNDHLALMPSGNVGIGTTVPTAKLHVAGNLRVDSDLGLATGKEIYFADNGQIRSADNAHRLLFRRTENKMELREAGDILFSTGATTGLEAVKVIINKDGNMGIGTTTPGYKLDVNGTARLGGFSAQEADEWPNLVWCRDTGNKWDEGLLKHGSQRGFFGRAGFGVHMETSRSFHLFSSNWTSLLGVEGGTGNTSIRGNLSCLGSVSSQDLNVAGTAGVVGQVDVLKGSNPIRFSAGWSDFASYLKDKRINNELTTRNAEISNDTVSYKCLMIVGNKSSGEDLSSTEGVRKVGIWDDLTVQRDLTVKRNLACTGTISSSNFRKIAMEWDLVEIQDADCRNSTQDGWVNVKGMEINFDLNQEAAMAFFFRGGGVARRLAPERAIRFNGSSYVDTEIRALPSDQITIEYWFKGERLGRGVSQQRYNNSADNKYIQVYNEKHCISSDGETNGVWVGSAHKDGRWHHIAMTWRRNTANGFKSYLDGELIEQKNTGDVGIPAVDSTVLIGSNLEREGAIGAFSEVRIWRVARSQAEIRAAMRQRLTGKEANLLSCFPLDDVKVEGSNRKVSDLVGNRWCTLPATAVVEEVIPAGSTTGAGGGWIGFGISAESTHKLSFRIWLSSRVWDPATKQLQATPVVSQFDYSVLESAVNDNSVRDALLTGLRLFPRGNHTISVQWKKTDGCTARMSDGATVRSLMVFQL